mmetsp:Transcript_44979/g.140885  ORF Transcript_44979/g.140885 Transcript_44979/m.140885 type:complete len:203 (-) Transcript_44979:2497-3105(-)
MRVSLRVRITVSSSCAGGALEDALVQDVGAGCATAAPFHPLEAVDAAAVIGRSRSRQRRRRHADDCRAKFARFGANGADHRAVGTRRARHARPIFSVVAGRAQRARRRLAGVASVARTACIRREHGLCGDLPQACALGAAAAPPHAGAGVGLVAESQRVAHDPERRDFYELQHGVRDVQKEELVVRARDGYPLMRLVISGHG